jgi:predicted O-methyltransferase YrrM
VEGVPFISPVEGRLVFDHLRRTKAQSALELGTAHGASAAYIAAAVRANGGGTVTTVDRYHFANPTPEDTLARAGLLDAVELVRIPHSSYVWWLKDQVAASSDKHGNCEPRYDFCYIDGAHNLAIDGLAVVLVERLLNPGGWLLLDDLDWTYETGGAPIPEDLSDEERREPHVRAVFDSVVHQHPAFSDFRVQDDHWGWARKKPGAQRRYRVRRPVTDLLLDRLARWRR